MNLHNQLCPWLEEPYKDLARAAAGNRLGHAWIIAGVPGVGKLNLALAFATGLVGGNTRHPPPSATPADITAAMRNKHVPSDHHPDLHLVFPEEQKKSIGVEQIRTTSEALQLTGHMGAAKVVVIEPAEAMTIAAANALLKSLEEPTDDTYLFLVAHRIGRLPSTIRSRCQTRVVRSPGPAELDRWLTSDARPAGAHLPRSGAREGVAPLVAAARLEIDYENIIIGLEDNINHIYEDRTEPLLIADQWLKQDVPMILEWLVGRIERAIRARVTFNGSNPVTVQSAPMLQNNWDTLTLSTLFEQRRAAQMLWDQLGGGVNVELALRVLLLGFHPNRGR